MTRAEVKRWQKKEPALDVQELPGAYEELAKLVRADYYSREEPSIRRLAIRYSLNINTIRRMINYEDRYAEVKR